MDSNDSKLREIEKDYFKKIVSKQKAIATSVVNELDELNRQGYQINLDATTEDGHIFYHLNGERLLLEVVDGIWRSKDDLVSFGTDELLSEIDHHPERFSNNVVTRPMMQEMVFPVLSFIGGPGEIGYWSALKPAFEEVDLQFPIITPRLSITFLDSKHKQWLERFGIDISQVINEGTNWYKMNWLKRQTSSPIEEMINQVSQDIDTLHQPVREVAYEIQDDLGSYADSNLKIIKSELNKLEKRMMKVVNDQHKHTIAQFEELNAYYYPECGLQERMWNIIHFMNEFGLELPNLLMSTPRRWEQDHLVVEI
nr:bacillithiol biosynthesis cysteine-adding enzyme BshC [Piscibacillus salipiscarius]